MLDRLTIERTLAVSDGAPIVIALSGGGDSIALLHLLAEEFGARRLLAVIVDHALRDGSAADAMRAAGLAEERGVAADVVRLSWDSDANRAQQAARGARYAALCHAARRIGARAIVTGHTRDDQAETVLLRAERGSGWRGLAGMKLFAPAPLWPEGRGLWLARPLLRQRRTELRAFLRERGAEWLEDPANANNAYARVRARRTLAALEAQGLDPMRFAALAERLAPRAEALDVEAAALVADAARFQNGVILLMRRQWRGAARGCALGALLAAAGGAERAPGEEQIGSLLARMDAPEFKAATLSGAVVTAIKDGWSLSRDTGAIEGRADGARKVPPFALTLGVEIVWDRRLAVTAAAPGWSITHALGKPIFHRQAGGERDDAPSLRWLLAERVAHLLAVDVKFFCKNTSEATL